MFQHHKVKQVNQVIAVEKLNSWSQRSVNIVQNFLKICKLYAITMLVIPHSRDVIRTLSKIYDRAFLWKWFVGNKAKGLISKRVFQENKARQIFRKMNISYPLIRTRTYQGVRNLRFSKHPFWDSPICLINELTGKLFHSFCTKT